MKLALAELERAIEARLNAQGLGHAAETAWAAAWLEACGYPGLKLLSEAMADDVKERVLASDALGLDLGNVSCAFIAGEVVRDTLANGRVFLRNVRHGLFLLPFSVRENIGIGCPVDPAFALGGERAKNPYIEKLDAAAEGLALDEERSLMLGKL